MEEGEDDSPPVIPTRPQESVDHEEEEGEEDSPLDAPLTVTKPPDGTLAGEEERLKGGELDQPVSGEDGLSLDAPVTGELDHSVEVDKEGGPGDPSFEAEAERPISEEVNSCTEPPDSSTVDREGEEDVGSKEGDDDSPQATALSPTNPPGSQGDDGQPLNGDEGAEVSVEPHRPADSLSGASEGGELVNREEEGEEGMIVEAPAKLPNSTVKEEDEGGKEEDGGKERAREDNTRGEGKEGDAGLPITISSEVQPTSDSTSELTQGEEGPTLSCETVADSSLSPVMVDAVKADEGLVCNGGAEKEEVLQCKGRCSLNRILCD